MRIELCDEYERYLAHYQTTAVVGNGEDECVVCAEDLTIEEIEEDGENVDPHGNKICWTCQARYYEFHPEVMPDVG